MPERVSIIKGAYLRDLLQQPVSLENTLDGLTTPPALAQIARRLSKGEFKRVVLTGMGSSFHALHPIALNLIEQGWTPVMMETSELVHHAARLLDAKTLIMAVSQSGQSAEVVRLMRINRRRSAVIAVTNNGRSTLAKAATAVLTTRAGQEFSVSCKTYVCTLMALRWLSDVLSGRDLRHTRRELKEAAPAVSAFLAAWEGHVRTCIKKLSSIHNLFLVGRGASLAAVGTGALIIKESDHFPAEGMSSAAFRHGPIELMDKRTLVLIFAGERKTANLNWRLATHIRDQGGRAEVISTDSATPCFQLSNHGSAIAAILEILPVQMITLALAALAHREAGKFERATKVTVTE